MIEAADMLSRFQKVRTEREGQWQVQCPAHEDRSPSLSISIGDVGWVFDCKAGCTAEAVMTAVGLRWPEMFRDSRNGNGNGSAPQLPRGIDAIYDYVDGSGKLLFQVVRKTGKKFLQRHRCPSGEDGWTWTLGGKADKCQCPRIETVLYHLDEVLGAAAAGKTVFVTEGEKDADNVRRLGAVATSSPLGAGKWRDRHAEALTGAKVVILPDKDEPGRGHAQMVASSLVGKAASIRVVELPGTGKDVSDWLAAGGTARELKKIVSEAPEYEQKAPAPRPMLCGLAIAKLVRHAAMDHVRFDLHLKYRSVNLVLVKLTAADLAAYRIVREKALESCVLLPMPSKAANIEWQNMLEAALGTVEQVAPDPEEVTASAVREELSRILETALDSEPEEMIIDIRRGMPVASGGQILILPQSVIRRIRTTLREDQPTREHILDAARALGMTEQRPRIDQQDRPRLWAFPDKRKRDAGEAAPTSLF